MIHKPSSFECAQDSSILTSSNSSHLICLPLLSLFPKIVKSWLSLCCRLEPWKYSFLFKSIENLGCFQLFSNSEVLFCKQLWKKMKREIFWRDYISFLGYNFNTNQLPANVIFSDVWKSTKCACQLFCLKNCLKQIFLNSV